MRFSIWRNSRKAIEAPRSSGPLEAPISSESLGGGEVDRLPARGELGMDLKNLVDSGRLKLMTGFATTAVRGAANRIIVEGETANGQRQIGPIDRIIAATGQRPDLSLARETAPRPRSLARKLQGARPVDRSERALLRIGTSAWTPRAGAS